MLSLKKTLLWGNDKALVALQKLEGITHTELILAKLIHRARNGKCVCAVSDGHMWCSYVGGFVLYTLVGE